MKRRLSFYHFKKIKRTKICTLYMRLEQLKVEKIYVFLHGYFNKIVVYVLILYGTT